MSTEQHSDDYPTHQLRVISHRCQGFGAPANSKTALCAALSSSAHEVELDFRLTRDGSFVAAHFPWYRTSRGKFLRVAATTHSRAQDDGLLTLTDALDIISEHSSHKGRRLEVKSRGAEEALLDAVRSRGLSERVTIVSWHSDSLRTLRSLDPTIRLGYSFLIGVQGGGRMPFTFPSAIPTLLRDRPNPINSVNIVPSCFAPTRAFVSDLRGLGVEVFLVTSYGLWGPERVKALGVDGVLTSDPGLFR